VPHIIQIHEVILGHRKCWRA